MGLLVSQPFTTLWSLCVTGIGSVFGNTIGISHRNCTVTEFTRTCTIVDYIRKLKKDFFKAKAHTE